MQPRRPDPHADGPVARARPRRRPAGGLARRAGPAAGALPGGLVPRRRPAPERRSPAAATASMPAAAWCRRRCSSAPTRPIRCCAIRGPRPARRSRRWPPTSPACEAVQVSLRQPGDRRRRAEHPRLLRADAAARPDRCACRCVRRRAVFHLIEGGVERQVDDQTFTLAEADTCCAPGYARGARWPTARAERPAFLFIADETPLHRKLGVFENRG